MEIIHSTHYDFNKFYKDFIYSNENVSWAYLPKFIEYQKYYSGTRFIKDLSFIIINENKPICICPLLVENIEGANLFTSGASYLKAPVINELLDNKFTQKVERYCFDQIDKLAKENNIVKLMMTLDPLSYHDNFNYLTQYGFLNSSISTTVFDLSKDINELWAGLRKSFQSLINNGKKKYTIEYIDYTNASFEIHEKYRELHHKAAGRVTRDLRTYEIQYKMLLDDNALLVGLRDKDKFIAFSYFFHFNGSIYYGSSSDDPDYQTDIPLEHTIIWAAIEYYKNRNYKYFEIGWQQFGEQIFDHPSKKDISISFFKRGFGGNLVNLFRGIKYYNKEFLEKDIRNNLSGLIVNYIIT